MYADVGNTRGLGRADQRVDVVFMAVDTAVGQQAENVQGMAPGCCKSMRKGRIAGKALFFQIKVDAADVLRHDPSGPDVEVADFRVAELAAGQAHGTLGCVDGAVGMVAAQAVPVGGAGQCDGIIIAVQAVAKAIQNQEQDRSDAFHEKSKFNRFVY